MNHNKPFPGADPIEPLPDTKRAVEVLFDALEAGATPDQALAHLATEGLVLEQANAFKLLVSVQKFREYRNAKSKVEMAMDAMPKDIDPSVTIGIDWAKPGGDFSVISPVPKKEKVAE